MDYIVLLFFNQLYLIPFDMLSGFPRYSNIKACREKRFDVLFKLNKLWCIYNKEKWTTTIFQVISIKNPLERNPEQ